MHDWFLCLLWVTLINAKENDSIWSAHKFGNNIIFIYLLSVLYITCYWNTFPLLNDQRVTLCGYALRGHFPRPSAMLDFISWFPTCDVAQVELGSSPMNRASQTTTRNYNAKPVDMSSARNGVWLIKTPLAKSMLYTRLVYSRKRYIHFRGSPGRILSPCALTWRRCVRHILIVCDFIAEKRQVSHVAHQLRAWFD